MTSSARKPVTVAGVAMTGFPQTEAGRRCRQTYLAATDDIVVAISAQVATARQARAGAAAAMSAQAPLDPTTGNVSSRWDVWRSTREG